MTVVGDRAAHQRAVRWIDVRALRPSAIEPVFLALVTTLSVVALTALAAKTATARVDALGSLRRAQRIGPLDSRYDDIAAGIERWRLFVPVAGIATVIALGLWMLHAYTNLVERRWSSVGLVLAWAGPITTGSLVYTVGHFGFTALADGAGAAWSGLRAAQQLWLPAGIAFVVAMVLYMTASFARLERPAPRKLSPLAWLPGANVFLPKRAIDEVWSATIGRPPILVDLWWIIGALGAAGQLIETPRPTSVGSLEVAMWTTAAQLAADGAIAVFAALSLVVVWRVTLAQGRMIAARRMVTLAHVGDHRRLGHR